jgi:pimeloyl-ACP methyl ester carboxylesterase
MKDYQKLYHSNQEEFLAYRKYYKKSNDKPGIIFLGGFKSDMNGTKAQAIASYAKKNNYDLLLFDYFGHGQSSGDFIDGTIGIWLQNTLDIIDNLTDNKPQILIGSSMGGWLMLLAALARPQIIQGLIGLAAAPDFTEELIWQKLSDQQKADIYEKKAIQYSNDFCDDAYPISLSLITEARQHLLLNNKININLPIRLIHGMADEDVPYNTSIRLTQQILSKDVRLELIKNSGHRLSSSEDLELIYQTIAELHG